MANFSTLPEAKSVSCESPETETVQGFGLHQLHYLEWGAENDGPVVVCVHGLTRNAHDFDVLACELSKHNYRVICPDMAGRGASDWLPFSAMYNYALYIADCTSLLAQTVSGEKVHWIGTSMGGIIGMMLEAGNPLFIDKLILNDVGPFLPKEAIYKIADYIAGPTVFDARQAAEAEIQVRMKTFGIAEGWQWQLVYRYSIVEKDGQFHLAYDPKIADAFFTSSGKKRPLPDMDLWSFWDMMKCKAILVMRGEESDLLPLEVARRMEEQENVSLMEVAGVGHAPMLMDEDQIQTVLSFLAEI